MNPISNLTVLREYGESEKQVREELLGQTLLYMRDYDYEPKGDVVCATNELNIFPISCHQIMESLDKPRCTVEKIYEMYQVVKKHEKSK